MDLAEWVRLFVILSVNGVLLGFGVFSHYTFYLWCFVFLRFMVSALDSGADHPDLHEHSAA